MGKFNENLLYRPFTTEDIKNKELILKLLRFEDEYYLSSLGQNIMADKGKNNLFSLDGCKTIQRIVLNNFGFTSTDNDITLYRTIFHNYYKSPTNFDKDILYSVYYMRENRLLYYTTPILEIGDIAPDCKLLELDSCNETSLYDILKEEPIRNTIVCAFSLS